jgi:SPP1 family predicted phage head-tail adaptor
MRAGDFRHLVQIQTETITGHGQRGQPVKTWATTYTVPAKIEDLQGRKLELARQLVSTATHQVTIRYIAGLTTRATRLLVGSNTFNVGNISNHMEANFVLVLTCTSEEGH